MTNFISMLSFIGMCFVGGNYPYTPPIVDTDSGPVSGKYLKLAPDRDVTAFLGIPFAKPPVGDLRFQKPHPVLKWSHILEATSKPPACMQYSSRNISWYATSKPSEDCLYLNVWVPGRCLDGVGVQPRQQHQPTKLPVLVWIYGGGLAGGSSDMSVYDGAALSSFGNAVVVTMNYRVGMFGFLNTGSALAAGNMGLLDQNLAMRWVKKNARCFGGDPENIALVGESAGAVSVGLHMVSPLSKGLFRRAVMQSASPFHPALTEKPETALFKGNAIASIVGCSDDKVNLFTDPNTVLQCLKTKDGLEIAKAEDVFTQKLPFFFLPSAGDDFLPIDPMTAMSTNQFSDVDLLIGNMKNEGTVFLNYLMPAIFDLNTEPSLNVAAAAQIIGGIFANSSSPPPEDVARFYLQGLTDDQPKRLVDAVADSYGDFIFACPSMFFAEKVRNVFYYDMTQRKAKTPEADWTGAPHFSDVPYVFGVPIFDEKNYTEDECHFSLDVIRKWMSFATQGNPLSTKKGERWPKFSSAAPQVRELSSGSRDVKRHPRWEACNFWRPYFVPQS